MQPQPQLDSNKHQTMYLLNRKESKGFGGTGRIVSASPFIKTNNAPIDSARDGNSICNPRSKSRLPFVKEMQKYRDKTMEMATKNRQI